MARRKNGAQAKEHASFVRRGVEDQGTALANVLDIPGDACLALIRLALFQVQYVKELRGCQQRFESQRVNCGGKGAAVGEAGRSYLGRRAPLMGGR
jgi:hypothetical protein